MTDLSARGAGGLTLVNAARRSHRGLPAVLLTGCPDRDAELAVRGALNGTFSLLRKPVSATFLVDRIVALLAVASAG